MEELIEARERLKMAEDSAILEMTLALEGREIEMDEFVEDEFFVYAEPKKNKFSRVTSIRGRGGVLEVEVEGYGWIPFEEAFITDIHFLLDNIIELWDK